MLCGSYILIQDFIISHFNYSIYLILSTSFPWNLSLILRPELSLWKTESCHVFVFRWLSTTNFANAEQGNHEYSWQPAPKLLFQLYFSSFPLLFSSHTGELLLLEKAKMRFSWFSVTLHLFIVTKILHSHWIASISKTKDISSLY